MFGITHAKGYGYVLLGFFSVPLKLKALLTNHISNHCLTCRLGWHPISHLPDCLSNQYNSRELTIGCLNACCQIKSILRPSLTLGYAEANFNSCCFVYADVRKYVSCALQFPPFSSIPGTIAKTGNSGLAGCASRRGTRILIKTIDEKNLKSAQCAEKKLNYSFIQSFIVKR